MRPLTVGSLFSGIGGFDLGLERAGFRVLWQVEIEPKCRSVLHRHWPDTAIYEDVRHVGRANLAPVDLICGGFPCQDLSVAGKRAGLAGKRSGLFHEFMRIAGELAPRWVLIENVPGLLSSDEGGDMGTVLGTLGELGYWWTYRVLDSRYFNLAQRRERVFIVGHLGAFCPPEILLEPACLPGDPAPGREAWQDAAGDAEAGAGGEGGGVANALPTKYRGDPHEGTDTLVTGTLDSGNARRPSGLNNEADVLVIARPLDTNAGDYSRSDSQAIVAHTLRAAGHDASEDGTGWGTPIVVADTLVSGGREMPPHGTGDGKNIIVARPLDTNAGDYSRSDSAAIVPGLNATQDPISTPDGMHALSDQRAAVLAFDTTQTTSPTNRCRPEPGDPCHPLAAGAHPPAIAFQGGSQQDQFVPPGAVVPTLAHSSNTHRGHHQPKLWHGPVPRRLTPVECSRLQGFPDTWNQWGLTEAGERVELSDSTRYAQLGNAVSVPVAAWIGHRLARAVVAALRGGT